MQRCITLNELAKALIARGYTTAALAREIGVSQPTVSRLASGKSQQLGWEAACKLVRLAGGRVEIPRVAEPCSSQAA